MTFNAVDTWAAMTHEERLAMAKFAPVVVSAWSISQYTMMVDGVGAVPAWERGYLGEFASIFVIDGKFFVSVLRGRKSKDEYFGTLKEAMNWSDEKLNENGRYVLDGPKEFEELCPTWGCKAPLDSKHIYCDEHRKK